MNIKLNTIVVAAACMALIGTLAACSGGGTNAANPTVTADPSNVAAPVNPTAPPSMAAPSGAAAPSQARADRPIGTDDVANAVKAATSIVPGARVYKVKPELRGNIPVWKVKLIANNGTPQLVEVDAASMKASAPILKADDDDASKHRAQLDATTASWQEAAQVALAKQPGSTLSKVSIDSPDNRPETPAWEITVLTPNKEIEYTVDAATKSVVSTDIDDRDRHNFDD